MTSRIHGRGVFAVRDSKAGEVVVTLDDSHPVISRKELTPEQSKYEIDVFIDKGGHERVVFAGTPERYINHSCDPNLYVKTDVSSGIRTAYAVREIHHGEELGWDYMVNAWEEWEIPMECRCGSNNCRKILHGNFFTLPDEVQRRWVDFLDEPFKIKFKDRIGLLKP